AARNDARGNPGRTSGARHEGGAGASTAPAECGHHREFALHPRGLSSVNSPNSSSGTTLIPIRPRDYARRCFRIEVVSGPDTGKFVRSNDDGEFTIGTALANQLVLNDGTISRHHCCITSMPAGFLLRDLGSKNGTKL